MEMDGGYDGSTWRSRAPPLWQESEEGTVTLPHIDYHKDKFGRDTSMGTQFGLSKGEEVVVAWHAADAASVDGLVDLERRWAHLGWLFFGLIVSRRSHTSLLGAFHVGTSARHELFFLIILTLVINFFFVRVCLVVDHFAEAFERPGNLVTAALGVLYFDNAGHARPNTASILICSNLVETHFKLIFLSFH